MTTPDNFLYNIANLQLALDQPAIPGKLILWSLLMLSLVCWVMILSKAVTLKKMKRADVLFTQRLRRSRTTLEVFEEGWNDENSLHHDIYLYGAKEAAFQLLGTREPNPTMHNRIKKAGKLSLRQIQLLREAFHRGEQAAIDKLQLTIPMLQAIAVGTPLLGATGMMLMMMRGFSTATEFGQVAPWISGSLIFMVLALSVALPAAIAKIIFQTRSRHRQRELSDFRVEITRLFERSFAGEDQIDTEDRVSHAPAPEEAAEFEDENLAEADEKEPSNDLEYRYKPKTSSGGKREFRSLRSAGLNILKVNEAEEEEEINPIAKQAADLRTAF